MSIRADVQVLMEDYVAAFEKRDAARCAAIYAEDAVIYSSFGPPIRGRDAIAAAHLDWFALGEENKRIEVLDCDSAGDHGYCIVRYSADSAADDGSTWEEAGANLCTLCRTDEGWRIRYSSMTDDVSD